MRISAPPRSACLTATRVSRALRCWRRGRAVRLLRADGTSRTSGADRAHHRRRRGSPRRTAGIAGHGLSDVSVGAADRAICPGRRQRSLRVRRRPGRRLAGPILRAWRCVRPGAARESGARRAGRRPDHCGALQDRARLGGRCADDRDLHRRQLLPGAAVRSGERRDGGEDRHSDLLVQRRFITAYDDRWALGFGTI